MIGLVPRSSIFLSDLSEISGNFSGSLAPWKILHCSARLSSTLSTVDDTLFQGTFTFFYSSSIANTGPFVNYLTSFLYLPPARALKESTHQDGHIHMYTEVLIIN